MLTREEIAAIRASWLRVATDRERAGRAFYETLFRMAPETRAMFQTSIEVQGRKLMETLAIVVEGLDEIEPLLPTLQQLGQLHAELGVRPHHYDLVGKVLLHTLREASGGTLDPAAEGAWRKAYNAISGIMKAAGPPGG